MEKCKKKSSNFPPHKSAATKRLWHFNPMTKHSLRKQKPTLSYPSRQMSDTTRRGLPDERVTIRYPTRKILHITAHPAPNAGSRHTPNKLLSVNEATFDSPPPYHKPDTHALLTPSHPDRPCLTDLLEAVEEGDHTIVALVSALLDMWQVVNDKGTTVTKRALK